MLGEYVVQTALSKKIITIIQILNKPSTELQGNAIGIQVTSFLLGIVGVVFLIRLDVNTKIFLTYFLVVGILIIFSTIEALWKLRQERHYGDFLMVSPAVSSETIVTESKEIIKKGQTEVCELHLVGNLGKMARYTREGKLGKLKVILESLLGLKMLREDFENKHYQNVKYLTARSDLAPYLYRFGFSEISDPPNFSFFNKVIKIIFEKRLRIQMGKDVGKEFEESNHKLAYISKNEFLAEEFIEKLNAEIIRAQTAIQDLTV